MSIEYDECVSRLVKVVRDVSRAEWSPTPEKKRLLAISARARELWQTLWLDEGLERAFDTRHREMAPVLDGDGRIAGESENEPTYAEVLNLLCQVAQVAESEAEKLPNSREKPALQIAALGFLHILYQAEQAFPALSNNSQGVREFSVILKRAGIVLSPERVRGALASAVDEFDPHTWPDGIAEIFQ